MLRILPEILVTYDTYATPFRIMKTFFSEYQVWVYSIRKIIPSQHY